MFHGTLKISMIGLGQEDEIEEIILRPAIWWHDTVYHEADHCMKWPHSFNVRFFLNLGRPRVLSSLRNCTWCIVSFNLPWKLSISLEKCLKITFYGLGKKNNNNNLFLCVFITLYIDFNKLKRFVNFVVKSVTTDPVIHVFNGEYCNWVFGKLSHHRKTRQHQIRIE